MAEVCWVDAIRETTHTTPRKLRGSPHNICNSPTAVDCASPKKMATKKRAARAPGIEPRTIYRALFTRIDENSHACKLCPPDKKNIKKFHLSNGYTNMMTHLESRHGDTYLQVVQDYLKRDHPPLAAPAPAPEMKKTVSQPTENAAALYGWLELMVMEDLPFTIVESEAFRHISRWEAISREALMRYLSLVHSNLMDRLGSLIPNRFGVIFHGTSDPPVSTFKISSHLILL